MKHLDNAQHKTYLQELVMQNKKLEAIKYIREHSGLGLKESAEVYGFFSKNGEFPGKLFSTYNIHKEASPETDSQVFNRFEKLQNETIERIKTHGKIEAIKYVKAQMNCHLSEAKELVDSLITEHEIELYAAQKQTTKTPKEQNFAPAQQQKEFRQKKEPKLQQQESRSKMTNSFGQQDGEITFGKNKNREARKLARRSNSGCMLIIGIFLLSSALLIGFVQLVTG